MKNFRKVLALVLVVATLFSFTAMTSAAYEDADKVSYKEAVDVLSAVGILNGYEVAEDEYEFKPTQTISREEMAKMIAVLANAGDDVSTLYASANTFADVAKDRWSASYVAYCAKTGIVAGRSASTFDPTGKVTGLETAKMLLVVLGFSAEEQGYVGADWKVNVLRDAKVMGLLNGFAADYDIDAQITREEAAQMMLNALEAPCVVGIVSDGIITVTNALVVNWKGLGNGGGLEMLKNLLKVTAYGQLKDAFDAGKWALYGNVIISNDLLATRLYGLTKTDANETADCYARPANVWGWTDAKGNDIVAGSKTLAPVFSEYATSVKAINKFLASYDLKDYYVTEYKNGDLVDDSNDDVVDTLKAGNGVLVQIFEVEQGDIDELRVIEIHTYIDYITDVDTYHKTVTVGTGANAHTAKNTFGLTTKDEGKVALYWECAGNHTADGYDLHDLELATPVVAKVTDAVKNNNTGAKYFIASGDKYEYSEDFNLTVNFDAKNYFGELVEGKNYGVGSEWNIYTDKYGYVMGYTPAGKTDYVYAVVDNSSVKEYEEYRNQDGTYKYSYKGALVHFEEDPAVGEAVAFDSSVWHLVDAGTAANAGHDALVKYYIDAQGEVAVDAADVAAVKFDAVGGQYLYAAGVCEIANGIYVTENTEILIRVLNPLTGKHEYKYFAGQEELDAKYELDYAQYFVNKAGNKVTYLYAEATYAKVSGYAYIMDDAESIVYLTDGNKVVGYNTYKAIVDGEEAIIATNDQVTDGFNKVYNLNAVLIGMKTKTGEPVYFQLVENTNGKLTTASDAVAVIDPTDGLIIIDGNAERLDSKAKFILVFTDGWGDDDFKVMTVEETVEYTSTWDHVYVWADDVDGDLDVDVIYVNAECGIKGHTAADH